MYSKEENEMLYEEPKMELIVLELRDVVTLSDKETDPEIDHNWG